MLNCFGVRALKGNAKLTVFLTLFTMLKQNVCCCDQRHPDLIPFWKTQSICPVLTPKRSLLVFYLPTNGLNDLCCSTRCVQIHLSLLKASASIYGLMFAHSTLKFKRTHQMCTFTEHDCMTDYCCITHIPIG